MTCNYNNNLPHIQILSRPNSKNGHFSSSNAITTDYAKSKWSGLGANFNVENEEMFKSFQGKTP